MPLYSKVEKRLAKKAKDEASGMAKLKAAVREELGEGSSSSGSSDSGSDSEQDSGDEEVEEDEDDDEDNDDGDNEEGQDDNNEDVEEEEQEDGSDGEQGPAAPRVANAKRKRTDVSEDEGAEDEEDGEDEGSETDGEGEQSDDDFDMTIEQVSAEPIYTTTSAEGQEVDTCVLCPGKVLKNSTMVGVHKESNSHRRAVKRWERYLAEHSDEIDAETDPRAIIQDIQDGISTQLSNTEKPKRNQKATSGKPPQSRAEKSKARKEKIQKKVEEKVQEAQKTGDASGLNRKARRLLAQQEKDKALSKASSMA